MDWRVLVYEGDPAAAADAARRYALARDRLGDLALLFVDRKRGSALALLDDDSHAAAIMRRDVLEPAGLAPACAATYELVSAEGERKALWEVCAATVSVLEARADASSQPLFEKLQGLMRELRAGSPSDRSAAA